MPAANDIRRVVTTHDASGKAIVGYDNVAPQTGGEAELGLYRRQHHRHRPHADASDGTEHDGGSKPPPGEGRLDPGVNSPGPEHLCLGVS